MVILSLEEYNAMMKAAKNAAYLNMVDRSMAQLENGNVVTKSMEELEAMESE